MEFSGNDCTTMFLCDLCTSISFSMALASARADSVNRCNVWPTLVVQNKSTCSVCVCVCAHFFLNPSTHSFIYSCSLNSLSLGENHFFPSTSNFFPGRVCVCSLWFCSQSIGFNILLFAIFPTGMYTVCALNSYIIHNLRVYCMLYDIELLVWSNYNRHFYKWAKKEDQSRR